MTRIRINDYEIPFDRADSTGFGLVHATGREVYTFNGDIWYWKPEYEDDDTVDLPETDPDFDPEDY